MPLQEISVPQNSKYVSLKKVQNLLPLIFNGRVQIGALLKLGTFMPIWHFFTRNLQNDPSVYLVIICRITYYLLRDRSNIDTLVHGQLLLVGIARIFDFVA